MEVSLIEILNAREARVALQQKLLEEYRSPLVSFTMNIAGPVKNTPLIQRGFQAGLDMLRTKLPSSSIRKQHIEIERTGCCAILCVDMDVARLKTICIEIEDSIPIGRLFDMDVIDTDGTKLERSQQRGCMVCGAPGRACAARRLHAVHVLQSTTQHILQEHFANVDAEYVSGIAVQSLIDEVNTTPKPGLVDLRNSGSHQDMTIQHFYASAEALRPYFNQCVKIGQDTSTSTPRETFRVLRAAGLEAEKTMYQATGNINTHKGAIYTLGILCGAIGRLWTGEIPVSPIDAILTECANIAKADVDEDLKNATGTTAGERCYLRYGIGGIRQEVASGLPSIREIGLPCYEQLLNNGQSQNEAGSITLLHLISQVADTNLYHRGGAEGAKWAANAAKELLSSPTISNMIALDDAFIKRNLSPGGCADLLAVTYFLHATK